MANSPYIVETVAQRQARAALLDVLCAEFAALPRASWTSMRRLLEDGIEVHEGRISMRCPALRGSSSRSLRELRAQGWLGRRIDGAYEVLKPTPLPDIRAAGTELHVVRQHQPMTFQDGVHVARARAVAAVDAASAGLPSAAYVEFCSMPALWGSDSRRHAGRCSVAATTGRRPRRRRRRPPGGKQPEALAPHPIQLGDKALVVGDRPQLAGCLPVLLQRPIRW